MKTIYFAIAAACAALVACSKEQKDAPESMPSSQQAELTIGLSQTSKAGGDVSADGTMNTIQVFVFNSGILDAYKAATAAEVALGEVQLKCTQGIRDIWVLVNAPQQSGTISASALASAVISMTETCGPGNFVMVGKAGGQNIGSVYQKDIAVDRIVSRVRLMKVKRDMAANGLGSVEFKITRIYLSDAADNACYDIFTPQYPSKFLWQNPSGGSINVSNPLVYKDAGAVALQDGKLYETVNSFYSCPNPGNNTKLIVEVLLDGKYYTYPVPIGKVESNKTYDIGQLTITRPGNPSNGDDVNDPGENQEISYATATFTIKVNDWDPVSTFGGADGVVDGNIEI